MFNSKKQLNANREVVSKPAATQQAVVQSAANIPQQPLSMAAKREENAIAILVDEDSGIEYYMETIDIFALDGRLYVAMFPVPEKKQLKSPQLVLLRIISGEGQAGQTMYESIRDKAELARVFDAFFARYENSLLNNQ